MEQILNIFKKEIDFYKDKDNKSWSKDKNEGFKLGIEYCKNIIEKLKEE
ncbi:hypothetical protein [Hathewaya massiliensis]|nr:hypothetical protein [Hathewaya massiliensis]